MEKYERAKAAIPCFDGNYEDLEGFLRGMSEALEIVGPDFEIWVTSNAKSKLLGEAKEAITGLTINTISDLGFHLAGRFA